MADDDGKRGREAFEGIAGRMIAAHDGVEEGRMMSCAAIAYRGKVFAFLGSKGKMVFRLGKGYEPDAAGLAGWSYLSPFKHKPPMRGWIIVPVALNARWSDLAEEALALMRAEVG
jgi:hypothetical protein